MQLIHNEKKKSNANVYHVLERLYLIALFHCSSLSVFCTLKFLTHNKKNNCRFMKTKKTHIDNVICLIFLFNVRMMMYESICHSLSLPPWLSHLLTHITVTGNRNEGGRIVGKQKRDTITQLCLQFFTLWLAVNVKTYSSLCLSHFLANFCASISPDLCQLGYARLI